MGFLPSILPIHSLVYFLNIEAVMGGAAWSPAAWSVRRSVAPAEALKGSPGVALGEWGRLTPRIHEDATRRRARSSQRSARRREARRERPRLHLAMNYVWPAGCAGWRAAGCSLQQGRGSRGCGRSLSLLKGPSQASLVVARPQDAHFSGQTTEGTQGLRGKLQWRALLPAFCVCPKVDKEP